MGRTIEELAQWARAHLRWFGQSAFRISAGSGMTVFIDPWRVPASAGPADLILITHPHSDHYNAKTVSALSRPGTKIVMPASGVREAAAGMRPGQTEKFRAVTVTATAAYNLSKRFHPQERAWLGYVVELEGMRIYHAGDTDLIPEMDGLQPDIALLPIGGMFTMDWRAAARAARSLGAALSIPMHFNSLIGGRKAGVRFCREAGEGSIVLPRS